MKQREGELERAKAIEALSSSILEAKEKLRFELVNREKKQRAKAVSYTHLRAHETREDRGLRLVG